MTPASTPCRSTPSPPKRRQTGPERRWRAVSHFSTKRSPSQREVHWDAPGQSRLWRFHLHYFDYAADLGQAFHLSGDLRYWERFRTLAESWIAANPPARGPGWEPFTISLRIVNWVRGYYRLEEPLTGDGAVRTRFLASLYGQARYLARNLEYDVTGNHLIKNGKALLFVGAFFRTAESQRWFERGLGILTGEAREQVLADGGHYERSPFYHAQVLSDYLEALALVPHERAERAQLEATVERMSAFLRAVLHPDGTLPLFNDGVLQPEPSTAALLGDAGASISTAAGQGPLQGGTPVGEPPAPPTVQSLADSGYYIFRAAEHSLILDGGPACPDHLPAHAHCDLLSFELSVGGQRIFTNSGTNQYEAGPWRDTFRGTAAHNTVQVNGEEQSAIWSSFRVGRRARVLEAAIHELDSGPYFRGRYIGFNGNRIEHTRELFLLPGPCWLFMDTVRNRKRPERLTATSRLHTHPGSHLSDEEPRVRIQGDSVGADLIPIGVERPRVETGWFSPDFGIREPCPVLSLSLEGRSPLRMGFAIASGPRPPEVAGFRQDEGGWSLELVWGERRYSLGTPS